MVKNMAVSNLGYLASLLYIYELNNLMGGWEWWVAKLIVEMGVMYGSCFSKSSLIWRNRGNGSNLEGTCMKRWISCSSTKILKMGIFPLLLFQGGTACTMQAMFRVSKTAKNQEERVCFLTLLTKWWAIQRQKRDMFKIPLGTLI